MNVGSGAGLSGSRTGASTKRRRAMGAAITTGLVALSGVFWIAGFFPTSQRAIAGLSFVVGVATGYGLYWVTWRVLFRAWRESLDRRLGNGAVQATLPLVLFALIWLLFPSVPTFAALTGASGGMCISFATWHPLWGRTVKPKELEK